MKTLSRVIGVCRQKGKTPCGNHEPSGTITTAASHFGGALYSDFLTQGPSHFFSAARLEANGRAAPTRTALVCDCKADGADGDRVRLEWLDRHYTLQDPEHPFTAGERRLIHAIGRVLTARYEALFNPDIAAKIFHLFRGLPEDRYVSAYLDPAPYTNLDTLAARQDRVGVCWFSLKRRTPSLRFGLNQHRSTTGCRRACSSGSSRRAGGW